MSHLSLDQIESYREGQSPSLDAHLAGCPRCRRELALTGRLNRALAEMEHARPSPELEARVNAAVAQAQAAERIRPAAIGAAPWMGLAALLASLLLFLFAFQTLQAFQEGGALDFMSLYASRPDLISAYPSESLAALFETLPLFELGLTLAVLLIAIVLLRQFMAARRVRPEARFNF